MSEQTPISAAQITDKLNMASARLDQTNMNAAEKETALNMLHHVKNSLCDDTSLIEMQNMDWLLSALIIGIDYGIAEEKTAGTDPLTGLANRRTYEEIGNRTLAQLQRDEIGSAALLFIDVVKFKDFNTNYGHHIGDEALKKIADTLKSTVRESDLVARIAGDEFIVLTIHNDDHHDFEPLRKKIYRAFDNTYLSHEGEDIPLAVSIGLTDLRPKDNLTSAAERADEDMYHEKTAQHALLVDLEATQTSINHTDRPTT